MTHDKRSLILTALSKSVLNLNETEEKIHQSKFYPVAGSFLFPLLKVSQVMFPIVNVFLGVGLKSTYPSTEYKRQGHFVSNGCVCWSNYG